MYRPNGLGVALVTPMDEQLRVDEPALRALVRSMIEGAVDFLVPCGTTGESVTLTEDEQRRVISLVVEEANGRLPVVAGAGSNNTVHATHLAYEAEKLGVDGILSISPYYNKPTQEGVYQHFRRLAESVTVGVTVYNCPGRTGSNVLPETVLRLAELPGVVAVKEASGNVDQIGELIRQAPAALAILSGDDALTLPVLSLGGHGVISVVGNQVPGEFAELVHAALEGDFKRAREMHMRLLPLMKANFLESNPIPVKTGLAMMGRMSGHLRLPLVAMSEGPRKTLRRALEDLDLVPREG
jgi:4-hydroxy-tetrahydrodipicolinate synthase